MSTTVHTSFGPTGASRVEIIEEEVPCGKAITTRYLDVDGKLLRQDCEIRVKEGLFVSGNQGKVS